MVLCIITITSVVRYARNTSSPYVLDSAYLPHALLYYLTIEISTASTLS